MSREEGRSLSDGEERPYASTYLQQFASVWEQRKIRCKANFTAPQGLAQFFGGKLTHFALRTSAENLCLTLSNLSKRQHP